MRAPESAMTIFLITVGPPDLRLRIASRWRQEGD